MIEHSSYHNHNHGHKNNTLLSIIGWIGVIFVLGAYVMNVFGFLAPSSFFYLFINFLGSSFIVIETLVERDFQPAFLNFVWAMVALIMLIRLFVIL